MLWILSLYLWTQSGLAESLETHYLARVAQARSPRQVEEFKSAYERLRIARTACQIQLSEHSMPLSCYEWLHFTSQLDFKEPGLVSLSQLDRLCAMAANDLRVEGEDSPYLSPGCAQKLREFRAIQAYRAEDVVPWSEN
jgi:hypothetical protein